MSRPRKYYDDLLRARRRDKSSTCYLFLQDVRPLSEWTISKQQVSKEGVERQRMGGLKSVQVKIQQSNAKFAPHIPVIKKMMASGATFREIGKKIGFAGETVRKYRKRNLHLFEESNESV